MRTIGVVARGVRAPILRTGDDLLQIVVDAVMNASFDSGAPIRDRDVIAVTESCVARTQGNYATLSQIVTDVQSKIAPSEDGRRRMGVIFPILSRNRFSMLLRAFSMAVDELYIQLAYPSDEVGNALTSLDALDQHQIDPYRDTITEAEYRRMFGERVEHQFTHVDYIALYKECAPNAVVFLSNDPRTMLSYTDQIIACDIHTRERTKRILRQAGARTALTMADILNQPVDGSGYNSEYGLYGSNIATHDTVKLFPRDCQTFVQALSDKFFEVTGKRVETLVYGDGAFKDPVCGIWELADPVVSPGYTEGLKETPNEIKLKYFADTKIPEMTGGAAAEAIKEAIREKEKAAKVDPDAAEGTTPRRFSDLLGSLADLTSGSGDKGTPIVWIQGYFDSYATELSSDQNSSES